MECSLIEPEILAAGSIPIDAQDVRALYQKGIRAILSLTEHPITRFREITFDLFDQLQISYFHIPIPDQFPPTFEQAQDILQIINNMKNQKRPVFVHCNAGIGRTGTILHLYYLAQRKSLEEARGLVRARRVQCVLLSDEQTTFLKAFARH